MFSFILMSSLLICSGESRGASLCVSQQSGSAPANFLKNILDIFCDSVLTQGQIDDGK